MRDFTSVSPTQIGAYIDCQRQWWFGWVLGLPKPQRPSAALGESVHKIAENYLLLGQQPSDTEEGRIFRAGMEHLPPPQTVRVEIKVDEAGLRLANVPVNGRIDVFDLKPDALVVLDHKTAGSLQYVLDEAKLAEDVQMIVYGRAAFELAQRAGYTPPAVRVGHVVYLTKGKPYSRKTTALLTREHVFDRWKKLEAVVTQMCVVAKAVRPDDVTPNWSACSKYGGCHFRDQCEVLKKINNNPKETHVSNPTPTMNPLAALAALRARAEATRASAAPTSDPAPVTTQAPAASISTPTPSPGMNASTAALIAKYAVKQAATTPTNGGGSSVTPPDAPPQTGSLVAPAASLTPAAPATVAAPAAQAASVGAEAAGEGERTSRRPKNWRTRLSALGWTEKQTELMTPETMREALGEEYRGEGYSVLSNGKLYKVQAASATEVATSVTSDSGKEWYYHDESESYVEASLTEAGEMAENGIKLIRVGSAEDVEKHKLALASAAASTASSDVTQLAPETGLILYIDCYPDRGRDRNFVYLEDIIHKQGYAQKSVDAYNRNATEKDRVDHYNLIPYNKGPAYVAAHFLSEVPIGAVVCNTKLSATNACLEVLMPRAAATVKASR